MGKGEVVGTQPCPSHVGRVASLSSTLEAAGQSPSG